MSWPTWTRALVPSIPTIFLSARLAQGPLTDESWGAALGRIPPYLTRGVAAMSGSATRYRQAKALPA